MTKQSLFIFTSWLHFQKAHDSHIVKYNKPCKPKCYNYPQNAATTNRALMQFETPAIRLLLYVLNYYRSHTIKRFNDLEDRQFHAVICDIAFLVVDTSFWRNEYSLSVHLSGAYFVFTENGNVRFHIKRSTSKSCSACWIKVRRQPTTSCQPESGL